MTKNFPSFEEWSKWKIDKKNGQEVLISNDNRGIVHHKNNEGILEEWIRASREIPSKEVPATKKNIATVIFLHGMTTDRRAHPFGKTGEGNNMEIPHPYIKYIFPQAPVNEWKLEGLMNHTSRNINWYKITGSALQIYLIGNQIGEKNDLLSEEQTLLKLNELTQKVRVDKRDLMESFNRVNQLIQQEIDKGIDPERIFLVGFSQGGSLALASSLLLKTKIGGFFAGSAFLPFWENSVEELFNKNKDAVNKETPILICNGTVDNWVPFWIGRKSVDLLTKNGWNKIDFKVKEDLDHAPHGEEIEKFLEKHLSKKIREETIKEKNKENLQKVKDWDLLSDTQKNDFLTRITADNFGQIKTEVEKVINVVKSKENNPPKRRPDEEGSSNYFPEQPESKKPRSETADESTPKTEQQLDDQNQQIRQDQENTKNNLSNDINKAQNGTDDDKVKAIKNSGRIFGEEGFEKEEARVAAFEEDLAINNPPKYLEAIIGKIEENLKKNKLSIEELDTEIQEEIKRIKDNKDNKINEHISKKGVQKRIKKLTEKVKKVSKLSKEKIKKLRDKVLKIINSSNKYEQGYKAEARQLLAQLDSYQTQSPNSNNNFPKGLVIGGGIVLAVGIILGIMIRRYKKRKN